MKIYSPNDENDNYNCDYYKNSTTNSNSNSKANYIHSYNKEIAYSGGTMNG